MVQENLPNWLTEIGKKMALQSKIFGGKLPNHVLINEYQSGGGIMVFIFPFSSKNLKYIEASH
jgi:alkylated DNA repair protein alkB family protein 6